jgi:ATP-binding cassette subfamily B protein
VTAPAGQQQSSELDQWRGIATEHSDEITERASIYLRRRCRELLADRLSLPWLVYRAIDFGVPPLLSSGDAQVLYQTVGLMVVAVLVQWGSRMFFLRQSGRIGQAVLLELRRRVFRHFQRLDVQFHDRYTTGRVVSRLTNDTDAIAELLAEGFDGLITAALTMIGVGVLLVTLDVRLGLACLVCFPILTVLIRWFSRASTRTYRRVRETSALVIVSFVETMTGIRAVQAYRRERRNAEIFTDLSQRYAEANTKSFRLIAIFMPGVRLIGNLTIGAVLLYGGHLVIEDQMTIGVLAAFLLYLRMFFEPMQEISQFYNMFQSASAALEKLSGVLEEKPTVRPVARPVPLPQARGAIDFENVFFSYVEGRDVLHEFDLHIPPGQTVALVGTTGAGKTTIAKLMARFYDPTGGRVLLDGVNLRDLTEDDLRRAVIMVTQENFMFDGTVADNIAFGRPSATREDIMHAAESVGAGTFIAGLPEGLDTDVGKRGGRLSAGQRQLITFARAFLADPRVLILDEATSSLDVPTERSVQRALQTVLADRTAVIIAHRLSTVGIADRVLVLEHGKIVEDGTPADLIARSGGRYASLHRAWLDSLA